MSLEDLKKSIQMLKDIEDIKKLKAKYCYACDAPYDADALAELFTEDAIWEAGPYGHYEGREAIRKFFAGVGKSITFGVHMVLTPNIEITGPNTARGKWYIIMAGTAAGNQAFWLVAKYDEDYVKVKNQWKFKKLIADFVFQTPYEKGWAKQRFM